MSISFLWNVAILARGQRIIHTAQQLLRGQRSPPPLTLCTSKRSSGAGRRRRSAPGCAGPQVSAQSCISFPQQSAPGARRCSSGRDRISGTGSREQRNCVPSSLKPKAAGPRSSASRPGSACAWPCGLG